MTSPLVSVRTQIVTDWEALTPPTDTTVGYHYLDGRTIPDGASSRRCFWFEIPESGDVTREMARTYAGVRHTFRARVRLVTSGLALAGQFDAVANESVLLMGSINERSNWPAGADFVQANGYVTEIETDGTIDLVIAIVADTQESNDG